MKQLYIIWNFHLWAQQ